MNQNYKQHTDDRLLALMREHDDGGAFDELYNRHVHQLIHTSVRKTGDSFVAQDLVQKLFVKFWVNRHKYVIHKTVPVYLQGVLRNPVVTHYYQEQARHPEAPEYVTQLVGELERVKNPPIRRGVRWLVGIYPKNNDRMINQSM